MKIHQIAGVNGNFGDELNGWLWHDLYPSLFDNADDGVNFIGIGSILDKRLPTRGLNVVLGTGTGYAPPPEVLAEPWRWRIYGVRGPLTAQLLGLEREAALTDPAILLAGHPRWRDTPRGDGGVVFVPHWKSVRFGQWQAACALAGIEFVDPCGDAHEVIGKIARARLVVAESMHAAIIADTFRVPWVPVVLSREVAPFKWADWAATLGLEYTPLLLSPSSPIEVLRARFLKHSAFSNIGSFVFQAREDGAPRELGWSRHHLRLDHAAAVARVNARWHWRFSIVAETLLKRVARSTPYTLQLVAPGVYRRYRERAADQLRQVVASPSHLSSDAAHQRALQRCQAAVEQLHADCRAGRLTTSHPARANSPAPGRELMHAREFDVPIQETR